MVKHSMKLAQILLVSKEKTPLNLTWPSDQNWGCQLETVESGWEALERVQSHRSHKVDMILLGLAPGDPDGLLILRWLRRVRPDLPVLVLASSDDPNQKLEAIRLGAQEFLVRPWQPRQLETAIRRFLFHTGEYSESEIVSDEIEQIGDDMFFIAASPSMRRLRAQAELLAQSSAPVFILGEKGSGKDLAARLIHQLSVRSGFRFLKLNCASLPGDVLESELFGGIAINGQSKPGKLELCQRGILFLDEITEMPLGLQAKLLHILREGYFVNLGGEGWIEMDVRILAATQVNPEQAVADRKLREDLYYRLSAFTVHVPALRQRKEEIPLLLGHFMNRLARRYNLPTRIFSAVALEACQHYSWPGNLRELEKFVKRYLLMGEGEAGAGKLYSDNDMAFRNSCQPDPSGNGGSMFEAADTHSGASGLRPSGLKSLVESVKGEAERSAIATALEQSRWNRKAAARLLRVSYRTLLYKIEHYQMTPPTARLPG
jgi:two-component system, NtrC family, response regulator AtoC